MKTFSRLIALLYPRTASLLGLLLLTAPGVTVLADSNYATPYYFSTLAGNTGGPGNDDGIGTAARFNAPKGTAIDAAGNIYVADSDNQTIRKITAAGVVTTFAGKPGASGEVDGTGIAARFDTPRFLAVDSGGNVFVTEENSHAIRKITPAGTVSVLAGDAANPGASDGNGANAHFNHPRGLAVDSSGNVYVADHSNNTIRKISPQGDVSTLAGSARIVGSLDGTGASARFSAPEGLAIDNIGNLYVADTGNSVIRKVTVDGQVTTFAGTAGKTGKLDGTGSAAQFAAPLNVAADATGNIFVSELPTAINGVPSQSIRKITPTAAVTTIAQIPVFGPAYHPNGVTGLTVDKTGVLYASITDDHLIYKVSATGTVVPWTGSANLSGSTNASGANARFNSPNGIAVDATGNVYVADQDNHTIRKITPAGVVTTFAGKANTPGSTDGTGSEARFNVPAGMALDAQGNLYVADQFNLTIRKVTPTGVVTTLAGTAGQFGTTDGDASTALFAQPTSIAIDHNGNLYVTDFLQVRKITPSGHVSTLPGVSEDDAVGIAVDQSGSLYISSLKQAVIRKITADGTVTILAGSPYQGGGNDGNGTAAQFYQPSNLTVDNAGNVYVADQYNCTIRKITPQGAVTTLAGASAIGPRTIDGMSFNPGGLIGTADGTGATARFYYPSGIAIDPSGTLYVANTRSNNIRKGQLAGAPIITTQPASQSAAAGASVQFSVIAGGVPEPTYQWYFNGSIFSGATGSSLSLPNLRESDAGDYTVVVTNASGTVTSNKATLAVTSASTPPPSTATGGGGGAISISFFIALLALNFVRFVSRPKKAEMHSTYSAT